MKKRCPWCGAQTFGPFTPRSERTAEAGRYCKLCGQRVERKIIKHTFLSTFILVVSCALIVGGIVLLASALRAFSRDGLVWISYYFWGLLIEIIAIQILSLRKHYFGVYKRFSEGQEENVVFNFDISLEFLDHKKGGYLFNKLNFKNGCILGLKFETDDRIYKKEIVSVVFENIIYSDKTAQGSCAFIHPHRIPSDMIQEGNKFYVYDNNRKVAFGVVTRYENITQNDVDLSQKRKNWQDPDYFN